MVDTNEQPSSGTFADDWDVLREIPQAKFVTGTSDVSEVLADDALDRAGLPKFAYVVSGKSFGLTSLSVWRIQVLKQGTSRRDGNPNIVIRYIEPIYVGATARSPIYVDKLGVARNTFTTSLKNVLFDQAAVEQVIAEVLKESVNSYRHSIHQWEESIQQLKKEITYYQEKIVEVQAFDPSSIWRKDVR